MRRYLLVLLGMLLPFVGVNADPYFGIDRCGVGIDMGFIDIELGPKNCGIPDGEFSVEKIRDT